MYRRQYATMVIAPALHSAARDSRPDGGYLTGLFSLAAARRTKSMNDYLP